MSQAEHSPDVARKEGGSAPPPHPFPGLATIWLDPLAPGIETAWDRTAPLAAHLPLDRLPDVIEARSPMVSFWQAGSIEAAPEPVAPPPPSGIAAPGPEGAVIAAGVDVNAAPADGVGVAYGQTFALHSNPASSLKLYLDFDGFTTSGTAWNDYWRSASFYSPAFSKADASEAFTAAELTAVQQVWQRVAEMFSPFNIDVTTEDPGAAGLRYDGAGDAAFGVRVVVTDEEGKNYGGIAYVGSFDWASDTPAYVYANRLSDNPKYIADAIGHEAGHTLGLDHDGTKSSEYYAGHGSGATDWAPIMGSGYGANIVQWSDGAYYDASNTEDDLAIITTQNSGVTYRADDYGDSFATAGSLDATVSGGTATVRTYGVISGSGANNDKDVFAFSVAAGGSLSLTVGAWTQVNVAGAAGPTYDQSPFSMLDLSLEVYDDGFNRIAASSDPARLDAAVSLANLAGGTYYLVLDGVGVGDPASATPTGYTEYGSLGQYMIRGTYSAASAVEPPPPSGRLVASSTSIRTGEDGADAAFTVRAEGATGEVSVRVAGLDAAEGALTATTVLLNAGNGWTATIGVAGRNDTRNDGDVGYQLQLGADGLTGTSVSVVNVDNDDAPLGPGAAQGSYKKAPTIANGTAAALAADDGNAVTLGEGTMGSAYRLEWRWRFSGLEAGDNIVHLDAAGGKEAFKMQYSTDGATWRDFAGRGGFATAWAGDFLAADVGAGGDLWLRLLDGAQSADRTRDTFLVDLMTVEGTAPAAGDWLA